MFVIKKIQKLQERKNSIKKQLNEIDFDLVSQHKGVHDGNPMQKNEYLNLLGLDKNDIETLQVFVNLLANDNNWTSELYPNGYNDTIIIEDIIKVVGNLKTFIENNKSINPIKISNYLKGNIQKQLNEMNLIENKKIDTNKKLNKKLSEKAKNKAIKILKKTNE